uniref:DUF4283 domain-containing protein n=1 Tax=Tanacetum cinerariifolium TaxID=118510 RepID=A0A6L2KSP6_TANCI|nr:hypothetical protein [Tanacetum cinerariifolium]
MADKSVEVGKLGNVTSEQVVKEKQSSLVDTTTPNVEHTGLYSYPPLPTHRSTPGGNSPGKSSYANVTGEPSRKTLNFRTLFTPGRNGIDVVVPVESIGAISDRFANTAYGFFLGKRLAYPVVANYVRNTWGKFGLVKSMLNSSTELFSFQFSSMDGLNAMIESGPCEDGLSDIATKLGTSLMLDSYTSDMCLKSWDMSSYARAMIELMADVELEDTIVVVMPKHTREGFYTCTVRVKYERNPLRCACCKVFGHTQEECPKNPGLGVAKSLKKAKGVLVGPKVSFKPAKEYRPISKKPTLNTSGN